jgi:hypothetical protein
VEGEGESDKGRCEGGKRTAEEDLGISEMSISTEWCSFTKLLEASAIMVSEEARGLLEVLFVGCSFWDVSCRAYQYQQKD